MRCTFRQYSIITLLLLVHGGAQAEEFIEIDEHQSSAQLATIDQDMAPISQLANSQPKEPENKASTQTLNYWQMMLDGFALKPLNSTAVSDLTRLYSNNISFIMQSLQRASPYMSNVIDALLQRDMPTELALLPVIESGFNPSALSSASAAGIWQFIPETGKRYGLQQSWLRDERRDPLSATDAALNYLQGLHQQFGDWHLALAAYNCGEGCVVRAQQRAREAHRNTDFSGISPYLPLETRNYVPRLVAVSNILSNYRQNLSALPRISDTPRITRIMINHPVDISSLARLVDMRYEELSLLNAGISRQVIPPNNIIWLPDNKIIKLRTMISESDKDASELLMNIRPVKSNAGESLAAFSERYMVDMDELRRINGISRSLSKIASGTLFIPRQKNEPVSSQNLTSLEPLKMVGEKTLRASKPLTTNDALLLAAHPEIMANSGWLPGRLKLSGNRSGRKQ